jgi:ADP-ribose pyrophosphatase YjhB (NUDIX family)
VLALRTPNLDDIVDSLTDPRQAEALDVLSIVAPTYGPPSKAKPRWTIPGGDIDPDEGLKDAAVRILLETTGAKTWPHVVETLWTGLDERGRLCHVLLARGFYLPATRYECAKGHVTSNVSTDDTIECGAVIGGQECKVLAKKRDGGKGAVWKSLVEVLSGPTAAPLVGIAVAVDLKKRALAQESALPNTLSVRLRSSANELVTLGLGRLAGVEPPGDMTNEERDERMFTIRSTLITPEEKSIVDAIISRQDEIDRMARPVTIGQREEDRGEGAGEETPYDEELSEEKDETNEDGFVRPPGPELNTR